MWGGWTQELNSELNWRSERQDYWKTPATRLFEAIPSDRLEFWCSWEGHYKSLKKLPAKVNWSYFPYHQLEPEPSIPFSAHGEEKSSHEVWREEPKTESVIYNLQTPCLRHASVQAFGESMTPINKKTADWNDVQKKWLWSRDSLSELKPFWEEIQNRLKKDESEIQPLLVKWLDFIEFSSTAKRGILFEKSHQ